MDIVDILEKKYGIRDDEKGQNYSNYKNGYRSCPLDVLIALSEILNTTADYLLGSEAEPRHTKAIHESTGLSVESSNILMNYNKNNPGIIKMLDALISGSSSDKPIPEILFWQFYNDYIASKSELESKEHDALVQKMYSVCQKIVHDSLSKEFDKMEQSKIDSGISDNPLCMADADLTEYVEYLHNNKQYLDKGFVESNQKFYDKKFNKSNVGHGNTK